MNTSPCRRDVVLGAASAAALSLAAVARPVHAQAFAPNKTVTLVVGFAPGGGADTAARLIAKQLSENIGQQVVVDNRAGAGGIIAHQFVAGAPADGSVILLGSVGPLAISPHLQKVPYDPVDGLAPLTMGLNFPNVLVVHPGLEVRTLAQYIARAKKEPGKLSFASSGVGSASHLAGELFNQRAGVEITHIPYKGGAPAMVDLIGGRVSSYYSVPSTADQHIASGRLIALATTGLERPKFIPDVPTIAESGFAGFNATNWYAFVAPGKTPAPILEGWNRELVKVLGQPDLREQLEKQGLTPQPGSRDELRRFIASESDTWGKVIRERKITAQ